MPFVSGPPRITGQFDRRGAYTDIPHVHEEATSNVVVRRIDRDLRRWPHIHRTESNGRFVSTTAAVGGAR
jgi:hypothetical protein